MIDDVGKVHLTWPTGEDTGLSLELETPGPGLRIIREGGGLVTLDVFEIPGLIGVLAAFGTDFLENFGTPEDVQSLGDILSAALIDLVFAHARMTGQDKDEVVNSLNRLIKQARG
jgi:hypothetical protein